LDLKGDFAPISGKGEEPMRPYFKKLTVFGRELNPGQIKSTEENVDQIKAIETQ
jgi:hypothetical protein